MYQLLHTHTLIEMALSHPGAELPGLFRAYIRGDLSQVTPPQRPDDMSVHDAVCLHYFDADQFGSDSDTSSDEEGEDDDSGGPSGPQYDQSPKAVAGEAPADKKQGNEHDDDQLSSAKPSKKIKIDIGELAVLRSFHHRGRSDMEMREASIAKKQADRQARDKARQAARAEKARLREISRSMFLPSGLPAMDLSPVQVRATRLGGARRLSKLAVLQKLIASGYHNISATDVYGNNAMHWACHALNSVPDEEEYVQRLLRRGQRQALRLEQGRKNLSAVIDSLVDAKVNDDDDNDNVIGSAAKQSVQDRLAGSQTGNLKQLQAVLWRQLTVSREQRRHRCLALVEMLQRNGGSLTAQNYEGMSPLHFAARTCEHALLADSLIHGYQKSKLSMQLGMAEIFECIRDAAQKLLECDRVTLFLADPSTCTLWSVVADSVGVSPFATSLRL